MGSCGLTWELQVFCWEHRARELHPLHPSSFPQFLPADAPVLDGVAHLCLCQPCLQPAASHSLCDDCAMPGGLGSFTLHGERAARVRERKEESFRKKQQNKEQKISFFLCLKRNLSLPGEKKRRGGR